MTFERKLASIQTILEITDIPNSDNIVLARINGWRSVVAKSYGLHVGDRCVYFEIDSKLPKTDTFSFMESCHYIVKTKRIRGVLSQGLIMPLNLFPIISEDIEENTDVTEFLGVEHKDNYGDECVGTVGKPMMPKYIKKTDCERIQNVKHMDSNKFYVTEKLDGSSATFAYINDTLVICSRRMDISGEYIYGDPKNTLWYKAADIHNLRDKLKMYPDLVFQGEIIGPGIQQNRYGLKDTQFYVFRIHDLTKDVFLSMADMIDMCTILSLYPVPLLLESVDYDSKTKDEWLKYADGKSALKNVDREGVVLAPIGTTRFSDYYSFKIVSNNFLLKQK